jgi:hypothetical protein
MKSAEDIESYLIRMDQPFETIGENMWLLKEGDQPTGLVLKIAGPLLIFRCKVMEIPKSHNEELYRTLLELNGTQMVHGAYAIEGDSVLLVGALQLENLDFNEFESLVDDITMAMANHYTLLAKYRAAA